MGRLRKPAAKHQLSPSPAATERALDHQSVPWRWYLC